MSAPRQIPDTVRELQNKASDPRVSAWVAANAGSGKTHVLTHRVVRLLLDGVDPAKILCITFTKAAAANMATRIFDILAEWTSLDDAELERRIRMIGGEPDEARRARARRLFALALETPGGLKVQTIHAFCTRLLHQFPFEADVAARFAVLDDTTERQLLDQLTLQVLLDAAEKPETPLGQALTTAIASTADQTFQDVVRETIGHREAVRTWIDGAGGLKAAVGELSQLLGINPAQTGEEIEAEFFLASLISTAEWPAIAALLAQGSTNDQKQKDRLLKAHVANGAERLKAYLSVFCVDESKKRENIVTRAIREKFPELHERLQQEQARVLDFIEKRHAVACRDRTAALLTIAAAVISSYQNEKERRGILDYDDLIEKTSALLTNVEAAWVHYKLDLGIDHVLIDEAQDTSPRQWDIIRRLVAEFTAGAGARGHIKRTIFAVGDEKQAIFSFQGSEPRQFAEMRRHFDKAHKDSHIAFEPVVLSHSFRSGEIVLDAVDEVYREQSVFASITSDIAGIPRHIALLDAAPGEVDIWPLIESSEKNEIEGWDAPFDTTTESSPRVRLAEKIARNVRMWLDQRAPIGNRRRPVTPGDILILVRQRGPLFEAIIRALKNSHIDVAGADRLVLTEHIAVMDLMALADALLLPWDDLALATVLKSPIFGFDDDDLFRIAWNRGNSSLHSSLVGRAGEELRFAEAALRIERLADAARREGPFTFYARLLGRGGGRKRILARLGPEAGDALGEFLNLALDYERRETPTLQGFVAWLRAARAEIKRDMEIAREEVRVMTVHGAKGLEAPIVILADTTTPPAGWHPPRLLALPAIGASPDTPDRWVWTASKDSDPIIVSQARMDATRATEDEYRRLLYVAMTRAQDRLVICGNASRRKKDGSLSVPEGCWYRLITDALLPKSQEFAAEDGDGKSWRYRTSEFALSGKKSADADKQDRAKVKIPDWLTRDAPARTTQALAVTPSASFETGNGAASRAATSLDQVEALIRGRVIHRLLQSLPDIPGERRAGAARRYLSRAAGDFTQAEHDEIVDKVLGLLDDSRFMPLFAPGSLAEVPVIGRITRKGLPDLAISGQIDRLAVTTGTVLIADYKTNRPAPCHLDEVPSAYRRQLALYRAVLGRVYPDRAIRAVLIWTDIPDLMEIPARELDAALATLISA